MNLRRQISIFVAFALISVGLSVLSGCIWIPTFGALSGRDVGSQVGERSSLRKFRSGIATRDQIVAFFGPPVSTSGDGTMISYAWSRKNSVVYTACFGKSTHSTSYRVDLRFDQKGVLESIERVKY